MDKLSFPKVFNKMKDHNAVNNDKSKYILKFRNHCNTTEQALSRFQNHPCREVSGGWEKMRK